MMKEPIRLDIGPGVTILSLVKCLASNEAIVKEAVESTEPGIIALPLGPEGLRDLERWSGDINELPLTDEDALYITGLREFEMARLPPPEHLTALKMAKEKGLRIKAIDLKEEEFSELFCGNVSLLHLWMRGRLSAKLIKKGISASSPEEYSDVWEEMLMRNKGLAAVEKAREQHMAEEIMELTAKGEKILVIIERERTTGLLAKIDELTKLPNLL